MGDFSELSEEEFSEYIKNYKTSENDVRSQLKENLNNLKGKISDCDKIFDQTQKAIDERDNINLEKNIHLLRQKLSTAVARLEKIAGDFKFQTEAKDINEPVEKKNVKFRYYDNTMIIELPELLPHRSVYDVVAKRMRYYYDADRWKMSYNQAFSNEFENGKFKIYNEKVTIIFFHHYDRSRRVVPDTDNLETKQIIDIIALYVLRDDSYEYMSHYVDVIEDDKEFTEIIVCPSNKFHEYIV